MSELRKRGKKEDPAQDADAGASAKEPLHPAGPAKHSKLVQVLRMLAFVTYFIVAIATAHTVQLVWWPLYFVNKQYYYSMIAFTKEQFGLILNSITQFFSPTTIRVSGDESVRDQLVQHSDGSLQVKFPDRMLIIANHQIYTDWLFFWWIAYAGRMHGYIYIILKESLKYIPIIGPGMLFFRFIFMARNWQKDKPRLQYRLQTLTTKHKDCSGSDILDPMWLLIFPEGTNLSENGRNSSRKWAEKTGIPDLQHQLLPRSTGLQFCLHELKGTVDWVYDCTIAYEGVPRGQYGQDIFGLWSTYFEGRPPKSVNMHWRRFAVKSIPIDDSKAFELWLRERWIEKDELLEQFQDTGRFPENQNGGTPQSGYIETSVKSRNRFEFLLIFAPFVAMCVVFSSLWLLGRRLQAALFP